MYSVREHHDDGIPYLIDNREGSPTLASVLDRLLRRGAWADIATGYLSLSGYRLLAEPLEQLQELRLLFGQSQIADELNRELRRERYRASTRSIVERLIAFLSRDGVAIKRYTGDFFHAKAYIVNGVAIVGSSNCTASGLTGNTELNALHKEQPIVESFSAWYERMWNAEASSDCKTELITTLQQSQFGAYPYIPHEIYIKTLYEYFKDDLESANTVDPLRSIVELTAFQHEAFQKAQRILRRYHGVMIADAVGLGKTFVGKKLLELYGYYQRLRALIICPAQLQTMWEREIEEARIPARIISMERLGLADFDPRVYADSEFILVDESHNFRNPATQRYQALATIIGSGEPKRVALLTATPISNSLWDLYHQIALWTRGSDAYFREAGIASLRRYFREAEQAGGSGGMLFNLLEEVVVRRTRSFIQEHFAEATISGQPLRFPERQLRTIDYSLSATYGGLFERIIQVIEGLRLPVYNPEGYKRALTTSEKRQEHTNQALNGLLKANLLKRFESSVAAFRISIHRLRGFIERYGQELQQGHLLQSGVYRLLLQLEEDGDSLGLAQALQRLTPIDPSEYDLIKLQADIQHDLAGLDRVIGLIDPITPSQDDKLIQFRQRLSELGGQKIIVFSYFRDTARYLIDQLKADPNLANVRMAYLSSEINPRDRQRTIERFAPRNSRTPIAASDEYDLLIATDVLSEGQNLQDAAQLINYDLHWNPTRMIQRGGRIDRLGSSHSTIVIHNIFPDQELETLLRLVERLQERLRAINETIGLDASVLGELITPRTFNTLRELAVGDDSSLQFWGQVSELAGNELLRQQLLNYLRDYGRHYVEGLPDGIHSCSQRGQRSGIFAYYRHEDRHFWRFWDSNAKVVSDNRFEIHELIRATPQQARDQEWLHPEQQEQALETIAHDILQSLEQRRVSALLGEKIDKTQRELGLILKQHWHKPSVDKTAAQMLYAALLNPLPAPFIKKLRRLHSEFGRTGDLNNLIAELQQLIEAHQLNQAPTTALVPTSQPLSRDDLQLICWMLIR
ncbi:helicase-related protein [Herpetosiphon gulosus]|uniref:RNA polymerase-associated protein RapA n=1 Tax=Herpetosiphon gulosus TaxID=1973496 RepID=A0ABP9X0Y8_9CHLR